MAIDLGMLRQMKLSLAVLTPEVKKTDRVGIAGGLQDVKALTRVHGSKPHFCIRPM